MSVETTTISVRLTSQDVARLDEMRGSGVSRSAFVKEVLRRSGPLEGYASHDEALEILTRLARAGKTAAAIALERALRSEGGSESKGDLWRLLHGDDE